VEQYLQILIAEIVQSALCNRYHLGRERLARWMLEAADRSGLTELPLTHDRLAQMIGRARSLVTADLLDLRKRKAIEYRRGSVTIKRAALATQACDCYARLRRAAAAARVASRSA